MNTPIDTSKAYDLDKLRKPGQRQSEEQRKAAAEQAEAALTAERARQEALVGEALKAQREEADKESVRRWDRSMRRTFKGITSRPVRIGFLEAEKKRLERAAAEQESA